MWAPSDQATSEMGRLRQGCGEYSTRVPGRSNDLRCRRTSGPRDGNRLVGSNSSETKAASGRRDFIGRQIVTPAFAVAPARLSPPLSPGRSATFSLPTVNPDTGRCSAARIPEDGRIMGEEMGAGISLAEEEYPPPGLPLERGRNTAGGRRLMVPQTGSAPPPFQGEVGWGYLSCSLFQLPAHHPNVILDIGRSREVPG